MCTKMMCYLELSATVLQCFIHTAKHCGKWKQSCWGRLPNETRTARNRGLKPSAELLLEGAAAVTKKNVQIQTEVHQYTKTKWFIELSAISRSTMLFIPLAILDPHHAYDRQNLIVCCYSHIQFFLKPASKFVDNFWAFLLKSNEWKSCV